MILVMIELGLVKLKDIDINNNLYINMSDYPFITRINKFKNQYIIEGCSFTNNFKIILEYDILFDEDKILVQKTEKSYREKLISFFELYVVYDIDFTTSMKMYREVY